MKNLFIVLTVVCLVLGGGVAFANGPEGDGDSKDKITIKDNNVLIGKGNTGIQGNKNHHNVVIGGDVNVGTLAGGKVVNKNKNTNTNTNTNTNLNLNCNKNTNKNTNKNLNLQGQIQGQKQGQKQGQEQGQDQNQSQSVNNDQSQSQSVKDSGNSNVNNENSNNSKQTTEVVVEGDTYEASKMHIEGPALMKSDAKFAHGKKFDGRNYGSVWDKVGYLTDKQAKRLGKGSSDAKIEEAVLMEKDFRTTLINKGAAGEFIGTLYVYPDGDDVTVGGMEGKAAERAMKLGATHMHRVYTSSGDVAEGDSWNIGIGGGASIITKGDSVAIAPNGGMGFGSATATNYNLPEMVFEIYCDETILKFKKTKKQTGNHTEFGSIQR